MPGIHFVLDEKETEFVKAALKAGESQDSITQIVFFARMLGKELAEVQSMIMDVRIGIQQVWRNIYVEEV